MNFLALFVGLGLERVLTHLFHLREFRWLDPLFDWLLSSRRLTQPNLAITAVALFIVLLVAPVGLMEILVSERFAYLPQFSFAVLVLLFCLGPRDLGKEVNDYCEALERQDENEIRDIAHELLEYWPESGDSAPDIEATIYAQANNRIFGVVFWFVMLGPSGAWLFRVLDLLRHRSVQKIHLDTADNGEAQLSQVVQSILVLHFMIAWIPSRLLALGYMLAGSYDGALAAWKALRMGAAAQSPTRSIDQLLGAVGKGAASWAGADDSVIGRILNARKLVTRTLWLIWCPMLAFLTLYDLVA